MQLFGLRVPYVHSRVPNFIFIGGRRCVRETLNISHLVKFAVSCPEGATRCTDEGKI